ncbi:MAG: YlmH/Sll1252 family protein [Eubacteriales bacterium]|nr:YlmH/Sll1252 family protein [Eubacteriales bacterium]
MNHRDKEDAQLFAGRIRDLARQAGTNDYLTHTGFLTLPEQSGAVSLMKAEGLRGVFFGGREEADRRVLFFLPSYMEEEDLVRQESDGEGSIACIRITVRGARFSRQIGHRDCLGALMHLGIGRDQVGDILLPEDGSCAYVYVLERVAEYICAELRTVGRSAVDPQIVPPSACTVKPVLVQKSGSIASVRIDSLIAMVFPMSRSAAQELVAREDVFADGRTVTSASYVPPEGCRISVRGFGKFLYEGTEKTTRKGRVVVRTSVYS